MRVSEISVKRIRVNQGLGVHDSGACQAGDLLKDQQLSIRYNAKEQEIKLGSTPLFKVMKSRYATYMHTVAFVLQCADSDLLNLTQRAFTIFI